MKINRKRQTVFNAVWKGGTIYGDKGGFYNLDTKKIYIVTGFGYDEEGERIITISGAGAPMTRFKEKYFTIKKERSNEKSNKKKTIKKIIRKSSKEKSCNKESNKESCKKRNIKVKRKTKVKRRNT